MREKQLAKAAGISVELLRYYQAHGIYADTAEEWIYRLQIAEKLRAVGFSVSEVSEILQNNTVFPDKIRALLLRLPSNDPLSAVLRAYHGEAIAAFADRLATTPRHKSQEVYRAEQRLRRNVRFGTVLFAAFAVLLAADGVLAWLGNAEYLPFCAHVLCCVLMFCGIEFSKYIAAAVNIVEMGILLWSILFFLQSGQLGAIGLLALRALLLLVSALWYAFGKSCDAFLYQRHHLGR